MRWGPLWIVAAAILIDSWIDDGSDAVQVERSHSLAPAHEVSESPERVQVFRKRAPASEPGTRMRAWSRPPAQARGPGRVETLRHPAGIKDFLRQTHSSPT